MTANRRIFLNVVATYGRSLYVTAIGLFSVRWIFQALGQVDYGLVGVVGGLTGFVSFINSLMASSVGRFFAVNVGAANKSKNVIEGVENCRKWFSTALLVHFVIATVLICIGYGFLHGFDYNGRIMEFSVVDVSGIPIDVFFPSKAAIAGKVLGHHPIWDPMRQYPSEKANTMYEFEFAAAAGFKEVMILGERVVVPTNAEEILTTEYGPWQIPDAKFNNIADRVFRELPGYAYRVTADEILAR